MSKTSSICAAADWPAGCERSRNPAAAAGSGRGSGKRTPTLRCYKHRRAKSNPKPEGEHGDESAQSYTWRQMEVVYRFNHSLMSGNPHIQSLNVCCISDLRYTTGWTTPRYLSRQIHAWNRGRPVKGNHQSIHQCIHQNSSWIHFVKKCNRGRSSPALSRP